MTTCPTCNGKRTIAEDVRDRGFSGGASYPKSSHTVERLHQCPLCRGKGTVTDLDVVLRATAEIQLAFSDRAHQQLDGLSHPLMPLTGADS